MKKDKTLHFFSEFYYPESNSTSYYITKIIHTCSKAWNGGLRVNCAIPLHGEEVLEGPNIRISRLNLSFLSKNHLVSRLLRFVFITIYFSFIALVKVKKNDKVFAVTNPATALIVLSLFRRFIHFQFILLVYDIFPEVLIPGGLLSSKSFLYKLTKNVFNSAYNQADKIIVIGRDMKEVVEKKISDPSKIELLSNWADVSACYPLQKNENPILKRLEINNSLVFSIAGNMGRTQGLDNVIKALSMAELDKRTFFLFMGDGASLNKLKEQKAKYNLDQVIITGHISSDEQNAMLNACDVAVISLAEGMYGLSVPSKFYFNIAAGKPILLIADEKSETARVIQEKNLGWIVPPNNPQELAKALKKIQGLSQDQLQEYGYNARRESEQFYSEEAVLPKYVTCICK